MNSDFLFRLFKILRGRTFNMERRKQPTCEDCLWCYDWCMHDPPACFEKEIHDMRLHPLYAKQWRVEACGSLGLKT